MNLTPAQRARCITSMRPGSAPEPIAVKTRRRPRGSGDHSQRKAWERQMYQLPGVFLPIRCLNEANRRDHWTEKAKRAKEQRGVVAMAVWRRGRMSLPAAVVLIRYGPRVLDMDGLVRSLKAVRDGVADAFGVDDREGCGLSFGYRQEKSRWYGVRIEIEPTGKVQS
jgi:hypothetical protein